MDGVGSISVALGDFAFFFFFLPDWCLIDLLVLPLFHDVQPVSLISFFFFFFRLLFFWHPLDRPWIQISKTNPHWTHQSQIPLTTPPQLIKRTQKPKWPVTYIFIYPNTISLYPVSLYIPFFNLHHVSLESGSSYTLSIIIPIYHVSLECDSLRLKIGLHQFQTPSHLSLLSGGLFLFLFFLLLLVMSMSHHIYKRRIIYLACL